MSCSIHNNLVAFRIRQTDEASLRVQPSSKQHNKNCVDYAHHEEKDAFTSPGRNKGEKIPDKLDDCLQSQLSTVIRTTDEI